MHTKVQITWRTLMCAVAFVLSAWYHVGDAVLSLEPNQFGYDFQLRYNETKCVLAGVDPFLIWTGARELQPYVPFSNGGPMVDGIHDVVGAYPPWEYPLMMPFALLPKRVAQYAFFVLGILCSVALVGWSIFAGWRLRGDVGDGFLCGAFAVIPTYYVVYCLNYLNFGVMIALAMVCLAFCLDRGRNVLAGLCWSMMMVKPQIALLFAIPLLIGRRYLTIAVAAGICLALTLVSAFVCGRSPIAMILCVGQCQDMFPKFYLLGPEVADWLKAIAPAFPLCVNVVIGLLACVVLSLRFKGCEGWLMKLLPTMVLCWLWSVSRFYDQSVLVVGFAMVAMCLLRLGGNQWRAWAVLGALVLREVLVQTSSDVLAWLSLLTAISSFAGMMVVKKQVLKESLFTSFVFFSFASLFQNLSSDVAFPILTLPLLAHKKINSRIGIVGLAIVVVVAGMVTEMSQWACSAIPYYVVFVLLFFSVASASAMSSFVTASVLSPKRRR